MLTRCLVWIYCNGNSGYRCIGSFMGYITRFFKLDDEFSKAKSGWSTHDSGIRALPSGVESYNFDEWWGKLVYVNTFWEIGR